MTITYDLSSSDEDSLNISKVRLEIGDKVSGSGPLPQGENFTDAEIALFLDEENDSIKLAAARCCDVLAREWAIIVNTTSGPLRQEFGTVANNWKEQAKELRDQAGGSTPGFGVSSGRSDGYADEAASAEYSQ